MSDDNSLADLNRRLRTGNDQETLALVRRSPSRSWVASAARLASTLQALRTELSPAVEGVAERRGLGQGAL